MKREKIETGLGDSRMWEASLKGNTTPLERHLRHSKLSVAGAGGCLVLAPPGRSACATFRFGLLLSAISWLTHILEAVF